MMDTRTKLLEEIETLTTEQQYELLQRMKEYIEKQRQEAEAALFFEAWEKNLDRMPEILNSKKGLISIFSTIYDAKKNSPFYMLFIGYLIGIEAGMNTVKELNDIA